MTFSASQWQPTTYDNDTFKLDSYDFMVSSEKAYSFDYDTASDTYRFEVHKGDQFTSSRFSDVSGSERSEISQSLRQSISGAANYTSAKWSFMIEPGAANTAKWMSLGQFHSGMNKSGPFDFGLRGDDKLSFVIRSSAGEKEIELPANVQRGHWYDIKVDLHFGPSGGGYVKVWLDGQQVVNYTGAVGYTDQSTTHWNMGIYRSSPAGGETIAYNVKGLDLSYGSSDTAANHGTPTDSGTSASDPPSAPDTNGQSIHDGFDAAYYLQANPDVRAACMDAAFHFETYGWKEGRDPNALFDTSEYLAIYTDVRAAGINPLEHYNADGWKEGRDPSGDFDTTSYLAAYADVAAAGINPLQHYLQFGIHEGRSSFGDSVIG